jgi:hypothetical protein
MNMMHHRQMRYIGLDVHRATIAVALAEEEGASSSYGTIANDAAAVRKTMKQRGGKDVETAGCLRGWADRVRAAPAAQQAGQRVHGGGTLADPHAAR